MAELKPCPILVASPRMDGTLCMKQHCAWWDELTECCCVPLMAGILADVWNRRDGGKENAVD